MAEEQKRGEENRSRTEKKTKEQRGELKNKRKMMSYVLVN